MAYCATSVLLRQPLIETRVAGAGVVAVVIKRPVDCQNDIIADVRRKATTEAEWRRGPAEWAEPDATRLFYLGVEPAFGVKVIRAPPCIFHLRCSISRTRECVSVDLM